MEKNGDVLVQVENLRKLFPVGGGFFQQTEMFIHAVDDINFEIRAGTSMGLVGESGCGKSTTGKLLVRLYEPTSGHIRIRTESGGLDDVAFRKGSEMRTFRRRVQMIFQDPFESLNPRRTIFDTVAEPLQVQGIGTVTEREERAANLLERVGLTPASSFLFRYPHELSGGQRQRVAIARALVVDPIFIVADEPTSMLDVSIRTGVMNLMSELADELGVSYLYITHDLAVARYMSENLAVMYTGKIVESGPTEEVLHNPRHPYTRALISAVPVPDPTIKREAVDIKGSVARPINPPARCRFYARCPIADDFCRDNDHPPLEDKGGGHLVACYKVSAIS